MSERLMKQLELDIPIDQSLGFEVVRFCDDTGEPMCEGWCWGDGEGYNKYESDVIAELNNNLNAYGMDTNLHGEKIYRTNEELLESANNLDIVYWTEWFDDYTEALEGDEIQPHERKLIMELLK